MNARLCGLLYLTLKVAGVFAIGFIRLSLVVPGNAAASAHNILASQTLWRSGFASLILLGVCYVAVALLFYSLFRPFNKTLSLLAACFSLVGVSICVGSALGYFAPLFMLDGSASLKAFDTQQLQAIAILAIRIEAYGYHLSLVFFAAGLLCNAYLMYTSALFPKYLAVLPAIGALSYLLSGFGLFLMPSSELLTSPLILAPGLVAEVLFCLWLIIAGTRTTLQAYIR
ncbi:MAG: DUF4386 domain-containing protein [Candidatus Eremiobacteraeota bacterium]|nr:DUF4386 domain-containing protein [Candidatus Eremiobacteraeota bacterium]